MARIRLSKGQISGLEVDANLRFRDKYFYSQRIKNVSTNKVFMFKLTIEEQDESD